MYSTGIIYKIICNLDNNICYIGSTFNQLRHIWSSHKTGFKYWLKMKDLCEKCPMYKYFKKYGIENFTIIKIKEYLVCRENNKDNRHLLTYEQLWINKTKCVNIFLPCAILANFKKKLTSQVFEENKKIREEQNKQRCLLRIKNTPRKIFIN